MELGLLLLRLLLGALIFGHGMQKLTGWFGGPGPRGAAPLFDSWGLRPGRRLVVVAALCEITAAVSITLGVLTSLGAAIAIGTMLVAASVNFAKGLWAQAGGYELPLVYAGTAAGLALTGPGAWSLDHLLGLGTYAGGRWGLISIAAALAGAAAMVGYSARNKAPQHA